jgi:hypothetical protein
MRKHLTDGELRASLDGEITAERSQHLKSCMDCQARYHTLESESQQIGHRLVFLTPSPDEPARSTQRAWGRFSQRILNKKENSMFKRLFAFPVVRIGSIALLILALVLAFPGTRALADEILNLFRIQQVTVIPIDFTGLEQLAGDGALGNQFTDLISSSMNMTQKPSDPVPAADAEEASNLAGFTVRLPQNETPSQIYVTGAAAFSLTVDKAKAQALLNEAGRSDLVLPDSIDGADISVDIPASVSVGYGTCPKPQTDGSSDDKDSQIPGRRYPDCVILAEIPSPTVNAPAGVDVNQLAQIGLEFTGMSAEDAAAFANSVDWTSTLVVPIPKNAATYEQVQVDGVTGTLIQRPSDDAPRYALLWVKDGIVRVISALGTDSQHAIALANSLP